MHSGSPARPTYSKLRTGILAITPGDKCKTYCKGASCKYCLPFKGDGNAIPGLYSSWITEKLLAMARLPFDLETIIPHLKSQGVKTVVNLQEAGEHGHCGAGIGPSGFSYEPEALMLHDIFYFNFPLPDFSGCEPERLIEICKAVSSRLEEGKVAVHCHAGHGRTGMIIAGMLMFLNKMTASQAVELVRSHRAQSVQSSDQVDSLIAFESLLRLGGGDVIPQEKYQTCAEYVSYSSKFLPKSDLRLFGRVPCVIYIGVKRALRASWETVEMTFRPEESGPKIFFVRCLHPIEPSYDAEEASLRLARGPLVALKEYQKMIEDGCSLTNLQTFLQSMDLVAVLRFLHFFVSSAFHQLTTSKQAKRFLAGIVESESEVNWQKVATIAGGYKAKNFLPDKQNIMDWSQSLALLCWLCARLPSQLLAPVSRLVSDAFVHSLELTDSIRRVARELTG